MPRVQLDFPDDQFYFSTVLTVRATDINAANHVGNESMIAMVSEARSRFLFAFGVPETSLDGPGIIVTDLATIYRAEAYRRDELLFYVGVMDFNKYGGDLIYRITRPGDQKLIAMAKTGFVFYYYKAGRVCPMPDDFRARFERVNQVD